MAATALSTGGRRLVKPMPVLAALALLAGCSGPGNQFARAPVDPVTTASITSEPGTSISLIDLDAMRQAISGSLAVLAGGTVFWSNSESGSDGIIEFATIESEASCRPFAVTVSDLRGIRRYRSEACPGSEGGWDFAEITPEDSVLL
ncbi:MAG: hypothetical protein IT535_13965 [Bauldia sp.]|nr:hypothetical protein [Bauldia sp.]